MRIIRLLAAFSVGLYCTTAYGDFVVNISATVTAVDGDHFKYTYIIENALNSDLPAVYFALDVSESSALSSIINPAGWLNSYVVGDPQIVWQASDSAFAIMPGNSLTFSFLSGLPPLNRDYLVAGFDVISGALEYSQGFILAPGVSTIPEPSSLMSLGLGLALLAGYAKQWRPRSV